MLSGVCGLHAKAFRMRYREDHFLWLAMTFMTSGRVGRRAAIEMTSRSVSSGLFKRSSMTR